MTITDENGDAIAMRLTNSSGMLDEPIPIEAPQRSDSQTPGALSKPFTSVNLYARKENYEEIYIEQVQIFADTVTEQDLELIPLSEFPDNWIKTERFDTPPQNL